jgi:hypothetical protein
MQVRQDRCLLEQDRVAMGAGASGGGDGAQAAARPATASSTAMRTATPLLT